MSRHAPLPFGQALRRARLAAGLSQEALAERAGLSARTVSDLERGVATQPHLETVHLLATALALTAPERVDLLAAARPPVRADTTTFVAPARRDRVAVFSAPGLVPLVGRGRELALLTHFLAGADAAGPAAPPLLLLAGEPGIGKTRLLQAATQQAVAQGWGVLAGGCHRRGGQEPYSPLLDALARYLCALPPDRLRTALAGCAWLGRLLPELTAALEPLPAGTLAPEQERRLLFAAVARCLANVAGSAGTFLVLDDLQWATMDALDLLVTLVRAGPAAAAPLRVVGAYRDTEVRPDDPLGHLRADLAQAGLLHHHALGPLAPGDAAELLTDLLAAGGARASADHTMVPRVLERARGTPFYLVSYAQALRAAHGHEHEQGLEAVPAVPWDVAQGVRQRVALLPEAARQLLSIAVIVGRRVPWTVLVAVSGQDEAEVLTGLEAACRARLLLEERDDAYAFAHDVIREVVEADVGAARRAVLHRRVAAALEGDPGGAPAELLAYHYTRAGRDDKALPYLEQAGDRAWDQRAHGAAEHHYRALLDALDAAERLGHRPRPAAARVREKLGEVLYQTGRYDAAIAALEPAADAFRAGGDLEGLGRVAAQIGWMYTLRGTPRAGLALIEPLVALLERGGAPLALPALYTAWGQLLASTGQYASSLAANERALALVGADGDARIRVRAAYFRMAVFWLLGRLTDALRAGQEMLPLAEAAGHLNILLGTLRDLSEMYALRGALAASRACIERASTLAAPMADPGVAAYTLAQRAWVLFLCGDGPGAASAMDEAVALSRQAGRSWYAPHPLLFGARLALAKGAWVDAAVAAQEALALADETADLQAPRWAAAVLAEIAVREGRPEAASARLEPLLDRPGLEECDVTALLPVLAWAYLEQGRLDEAAATVAQALARARREEMRLVLVEALRVQALIALRREQGDEAARSLAEGLALAQDMPYPYAEARLRHVDGLRHAQHGVPQAARQRLEAARGLFARLGARADVAQMDQALNALPGAASPAAAGQRATLVPSEPARPDGVAATPAGHRLTRIDRQTWALARLRTEGALSPRAYAAALGVSLDTALRDLNALIQRGHIVAQGTTKDRRYVLHGAAEEVHR